MTKRTQPKPDSKPTTPDVIVPPPPLAIDYAAMLNDAQARIADLEARLNGADQARAAYQLERDAARKALDTALEEPCTLCGKQRKDTK